MRNSYKNIVLFRMCVYNSKSIKLKVQKYG